MIAIAHRPTAAAGVVLLGAGIIAAMPSISPVSPSIPHLDAPQIALQASVLDIFKFPSLQQIAVNQVDVLAIEAQGLAEAGQGAVQSLVQLPSALITATRQVLAGDALGGLTTLENWTVDSAQATFVPVIAARITVGQIDLAIQSALLPAWPLALVSLAGGLFEGADTIARGLITAGQDLVAAVLSLNLGNIVQAVVGGIRTIAASVVAGGQTAVDGVVGAQNLLADALAARPTPPPPGAAIPAVAALRTATPAAAVKAAVKPAGQTTDTGAELSTGADPGTGAATPKPGRPKAARHQGSTHGAGNESASQPGQDNAGPNRSAKRSGARHAAGSN